MSARTTPERQDLEREQLESLNHLLKQVGETNTFYRPVLQQAGLADGRQIFVSFLQRCHSARRTRLLRINSSILPTEQI